MSGSIGPSSAKAEPKLDTANTSTSVKILKIFLYMILSPLQEFILHCQVGSFSNYLYGNLLTIKKPSRNYFGGLAVFQPLRIRLEDP
jgi:hypothetical protein